MDNKPMWLRILLDRIGIQSLVAFFIGVPAMIIFIQSIWNALSQDQRILAVVFGSLLLVAIILFIYSRTRKILYVIPMLLHKMHGRTVELASSLNPESLSEEDLNNFMSLTAINMVQLQSLKSSIPNIDSLINFAPDLIKIAENGSEKTKTDRDAVWRLQYFMFERIGLKEALKQDKMYGKLRKRLDKIQIPTVEIRQSILDCENISHIIGTWLPILHLPIGKAIYQTIFPLPFKIDSEVKVDELNNQMKLLLSKVEESIDKYYKGERK